MANLAGNPSNLIPFRPGQSGNPSGKPNGARNRITARFLHELASHFDEHGHEAIETVFRNKPDRYLMIVATLLPQKVDLSAPLEGMADEELYKAIDFFRTQLTMRGEGSDTNA